MGKMLREGLAARLWTAVAVLVTVAGCGGGGGGSESGTSPAPQTAPTPGTYTVKTAAGVSGSFMLDSGSTITACAVGRQSVCTGQLVSAANGRNFVLTGPSASISGTLAADGSITGQMTEGASTTQVTGALTSGEYIDCISPAARIEGRCVLPESRLVIAPTIFWLEEMAGGTWSEANGLRYNWRYSLCLGYGQCDRVIKTFLLTPDEMADAETQEAIQYAKSVAKEFQAMIGRLWKAKTYPSLAQMQKIFGDAVQAAIASDTQNAVETAANGFAAAGYPAAGGGTASGPSGAEPTVASACGNLAYTGDTSEPQVYVYDRYAQHLSCMYKATGEAQYLTNGDKICKILDGLLKSTVGTFRPLFCSGDKLRRS